MTAIVDLAHKVVYDSFKKHGKLAIEAPLPDADGYVTSTIGSVLQDQFAALGLAQYIEVIPSPTRRERLRARRSSDV